MPLPSRTNSVFLLTTGGTIAMREGNIQNDLSNEDVLTCTGFSGHVKIKKLCNLPSVQMGFTDTLEVVQCAIRAAKAGMPVVVTHGTDILEEVALLCDLLYDGDIPIVFTGAMRLASAAGADGPANLRDSLIAATSQELVGCGVTICFAGELHAARYVQKDRSVDLNAFASFPVGPFGYVRETRVNLLFQPKRYPAVAVDSLQGTVEILTVGLGSDGSALDSLQTGGLDGLVLVAVGAGHLPPAVLTRLAVVAQRLPTVICVRPRYGTVLHHTYSFLGSERSLRQTNCIFAGSISPQAARIGLLVGLSAGMDIEALKVFFNWANF